MKMAHLPCIPKMKENRVIDNFKDSHYQLNVLMCIQLWLTRDE